MLPDDLIARAGELIRQGRLVAFPTETVYGLGANALDAQAVSRIYAAKGRPSTSPLIVHAESLEAARELAARWPDAAETLARRYWPGPLTLVLEKDPRIPDIVTAGLPTAGLRVPAHPVAQALLRAAGVPIAAPSANPFMRLSPTTAAHVRAGLGDAVDLVLDGGAAAVGIESTVLSLVAGRPVLLRPGAVTREEIERLIGPVETLEHAPAEAHPSPGMHQRHYSPRTPLLLRRTGEPLPPGRGAWLGFAPQEGCRFDQMPSQPAPYAAELYGRLHRWDEAGLDWIAVEAPPDAPEWAAIHDRLRRAAGGR